MKKTLFATVVVVSGLFTGTKVMAQNAIQLSYGFKKPVGNNISGAFKSNGGESVSLIHQLNESKWAIGATFNQQKFKSNANYFKDGYQADMSVSNALFSLRKKVFLKEEHHWYWGVDVGVAFNKFKNGNRITSATEKNVGFTRGFIIGSIWNINKQFAIDMNGTYQSTYTGDINYNEQFTKSNFKYTSLNLGVRYQL
jgi:hypothetical protein